MHSRTADKWTILCAALGYVLPVHRNLLESGWGHSGTILESVLYSSFKVVSNNTYFFNMFSPLPRRKWHDRSTEEHFKNPKTSRVLVRPSPFKELLRLGWWNLTMYCIQCLKLWGISTHLLYNNFKLNKLHSCFVTVKKLQIKQPHVLARVVGIFVYFLIQVSFK